jgi:hypothetical protein
VGPDCVALADDRPVVARLADRLREALHVARVEPRVGARVGGARELACRAVREELHDVVRRRRAVDELERGAGAVTECRRLGVLGRGTDLDTCHAAPLRSIGHP